MNTEQFSNEWDILVNAYIPDGLMFDEYEKSLWLTRSQEITVSRLYQEFERNEMAREILAPLIRTFVANEEYEGTVINPLYPASDNSHFYQLPIDLWLIVYEEAVLDSKDKCLKNKRVSVAPTTHDKLTKILGNPFKGPNENRALRLNLDNNVVEILTKYDLKRYFVRYIKKLNPIILTDLSDTYNMQTVSLFGDLTGTRGEVKTRTECELHESIHHDILELAVQMAIQSRRNNVTQQIQQTQENNQ